MKPLAPTFLDRAIALVSPGSAIKRMQARAMLRQYGFDGARIGPDRIPAKKNEGRADHRYERDRIQLMWEARELEDNFPIVTGLQRKYALHVAPQGYQAATGDRQLDLDVEAYLREKFFPACDFYETYSYFELCQFSVSGTKRDGDHGWGLIKDAELGVRIKAVEADLIGNPMAPKADQSQIGGVLLDDYGRIQAYDVFKRCSGSTLYALDDKFARKDFVHFIDAIRYSGYRPVSALASAVTTAKDLKETLDALRLLIKKHSSVTAFFLNSNGLQVPTVSTSAFDAFSETGVTASEKKIYQQTMPGLSYYLNDGEDVKFPESHMPSGEMQYLIDKLIQLICLVYNLPVSFAVDATKIGGVSARLESQQALAEFKRARAIFEPRWNRPKNLALLHAFQEGKFGPTTEERLAVITRGHWSYIEHPQPDIGKEADATIKLLGAALTDPLQQITSAGLDPETVVYNIAKFAALKKKAAEANGVTVEEAFAPATSSPVADIADVEVKQDQVDSQPQTNAAAVNQDISGNR